MTIPFQPGDERLLLDATREALAAVSEGLDASAVEQDTPLAALLFDSLMALNFVATLEVTLNVTDLPFERWLAEHSEHADALTIGSLVAWLGSIPEVAAGVAPGATGAAPVSAATRGPERG